MISKYKLNFLFIVFLSIMFVALTGCSQKPEVKPQVVSKSLKLSSDALVKIGLDEKWTIDTLYNNDAKIKNILKKGNNLLVYNSDSILYGINMLTGRVQWEVRFPTRYGNIALLSFYKNRVIVAISNQIFEVNIDKGETVMNWEIPFKPTTSISRDEKFVFVGGLDNMFYCLKLPSLIDVWKSLQSKRPIGDVWLDTRVVEGETVGSVYFACDNGKMYATSYEKPELLWSLETTGDVPGCIFDTDACFLPSTDTALYSINSKTGRIFWKYLAGGKLYDLPSVTDEHVYQSVSNKSLVCLERYPDGLTPASGLERVTPKVVWELAKGTNFLCESGSRVYAATESDQLVVVNNSTGEKEGSIDIAGVDMFYSNVEDDYVILAKDSGTITVLEPVR